MIVYLLFHGDGRIVSVSTQAAPNGFRRFVGIMPLVVALRRLRGTADPCRVVLEW